MQYSEHLDMVVQKNQFDEAMEPMDVAKLYHSLGMAVQQTGMVFVLLNHLESDRIRLWSVDQAQDYYDNMPLIQWPNKNVAIKHHTEINESRSNGNV